MEIVISVIQTALPVFLALALGMFCRSKNFLTRDGIDTLKKVVVNLTLPAVLVSAFATAEYSVSTIAIPIATYLVCIASLALGFVIARLVRAKSHFAPFLAAGYEAGMLGYALFALLFRDRSLSDFAILDIGHTLFVFTVYKIVLTGKTDWKAIVKDMVSTPILWAVAIGVLIGATGLYGAMQDWGISGVFDSATDFLGAPTGMIILLTVGYDLVLKEIRWKETAGFIAIRIIAMLFCLGAVVLLNRTLLNGIIFEGAMVLTCILPPPYVIPVFTDEPTERTQVSSALSTLTLLTIVLFAVLSVCFNF